MNTTGQIDLDRNKVECCGDPLHGLSTNGVLALTNGQTHPVYNPPNNGDCYIFKIPGLPTPPAAPGGLTWLNYAVLTGFNRRLYGRNIDSRAWLFLDASGVVWLASIQFPSALQATINLVNLRENAGGHSITANFDVTPISTPTQGEIFDISSDGRRLIVGYNMSFQERLGAILAEVVIAPDGNSMTLSLLVEQGNQAYSGITQNTALIRTYTVLNNWEKPYVEGENASNVELEQTYTRSHPITIGVPGPFSPPDSVHTILVNTILLRYVDDGTDVISHTIGYVYDQTDTRQPVIYTEDNSYAGAGIDYQNNYSIGAMGIDFKLTVGGSVSIPVHAQFNGSMVAGNTTMILTSGIVGTMAPRRLTNKIYCLVGSGHADGRLRFFPPQTPSGPGGSTVYLDAAPACSYQPETQQIAVGPSDNGVLCFI